MPVTTGRYANNETIVYDYIVNVLRLNTAIACGILANIEYESGFNQGNDTGDDGTSYGLFQFHKDRKTKLISYCSRAGLDYTTVKGQLTYMGYEFRNSEKSAYNKIKDLSNTAEGAELAGYNFCVHYERPSNKEEKGRIRGNAAKTRYWNYYSSNPTVSNKTVNIGQRIVQIARQQIGLPYNSSDEFRKGTLAYDCSGLVWYCYNTAGYEIKDLNSENLYKSYKDIGRKVISSNISAGDLLFYKNTVENKREYGITHVAISNGNGGLIEADPSTGVREVSSIGEPYKILRILPNEATSQGEVPTTTNTVVNYVALSSYDPYAIAAMKNISKVKEEGYDSGYLIDMSYGGQFKFYIPEFSESAGANWSTIDIIGRSVSIQSYTNTNSRTITISLDLYAGAGMYNSKTKEDIVGELHQDVNFVRSLEYPDYSNAITRPPATVHLILGSAVNIIGIVKGVTVEHKKPLDEYNRAMYIKLSFTVVQTAVNPLDYKDIRNGKSAITSTNNIKSIIGDSSNTMNNIG